VDPTFPTEPLPTAIALAIVGLLVAVAAILSRTIGRRGVPVVLLFMLLGMIAGSEGLGGIAFEDSSWRLCALAREFLEQTRPPIELRARSTPSSKHDPPPPRLRATGGSRG
jgi:hypothetical protein